MRINFSRRRTLWRTLSISVLHRSDETLAKNRINSFNHSPFNHCPDVKTCFVWKEIVGKLDNNVIIRNA